MIHGKNRMELLPEVPTAQEAGYPELAALTESYGFAVPAGTPDPVVRKLNADIVKVLNHPAVQSTVRALGMTPAPSSAEEFDRQMRLEHKRWAGLVDAVRIKAK
mgnify:CR=1 FL=1